MKVYGVFHVKRMDEFDVYNLKSPTGLGCYECDEIEARIGYYHPSYHPKLFYEPKSLWATEADAKISAGVSPCLIIRELSVNPPSGLFSAGSMEAMRGID